jgi:ATP phosphoribosyltransferase
MSTLLVGVPSKGRLQENAHAFFGRAGMTLLQPRGGRDYRGTIPELPGVEVVYLSASEITSHLAQGTIHLGVTGEDLVREMIADADKRVLLIDGLGFGFANVVVAVPQAWIDVRTMHDLDDVTTAFHAKHDRRMRVATKYVNLTRTFFARHGIGDYRIVESLGATEGAPATGAAELIVDITTTGATLAANGLKVLDDGVMLRSQANLIASLAANWGADERDAARALLDRVAAERRARTMREVRTRFRAADAELVAEAKGRFGVQAPLGGPTSSGMLTLLCPPDRVHELAIFLREAGAETVMVASPEFVFARENALYEALVRRLDRYGE